jgi:hypothetical protein
MRKLQNDYEKNLCRVVLDQIHKHPLHAIAMHEVEFYLMMTGQLSPPVPKLYEKPSVPKVFNLTFYCDNDLTQILNLGTYNVALTYNYVGDQSDFE